MITRVMLVLFVLSSALTFANPPVPQPDAKGCSDHPLFTRMPEFRIGRCLIAPFDARKFAVGDGRKVTQESIEGRVTDITYNFTGTGPMPSGLQFIRNYQNAIKQIGGVTLFEDSNHNETTIKLERSGTETWAKVNRYGGAYNITIVERQAMKQEIVANADALANELRNTGHASVYGIYFDTGLAVVKPESRAAVQEIVKLLTANPNLKLRVVGHTDSVGTLDSNMKLSQARAESVVKMMTTEFKVAPDRLTGHGVGPLAPVASNQTDEGKAKNRRVELIEQ